MVSEKSSRPYSSRLRAEQAAATRTRVVAAAAELFAARGYAGTSMPEIARQAGVSTETVQSHGPKSALLRDAIDAFAFGAERDADARDTELGARMLAARTGPEAAGIAADVLTQVNCCDARAVARLRRGRPDRPRDRRGASRVWPPVSESRTSR